MSFYAFGVMKQGVSSALSRQQVFLEPVYGLEPSGAEQR